MAAQAAGAGILAALLLTSGGKGSTAQTSQGAQAPPPVWARMRWIDYSWQMILPMSNMHPPPPPGQTGPVGGQPSSGIWKYWKIGPNGYAVNANGHPVSHKAERGLHEIENPKGKPGEYLYVWYPRPGQLQNINGYWVYATAKGHSHPPSKPPSAPPGKWQNRAGNTEYWVWLNKANMHDDAYIKQFAWFTFHQVVGNAWRASKIIATSARGVTLPDETDASGLTLFLLTPQQAAQDAQVLNAAGASQPPNAAPAPMVTSSGPQASA